MATTICTACSTKNLCNSIKCEQCGSVLSKTDYYEVDEWEHDFRLIEEAELNGNVYKIENLGECFPSVIEENALEALQVIKEEPEFHIEPDNINETKVDSEQTCREYRYVCRECKMSFKRKASLTAHINSEHCLNNDIDSDPVEEKLWQSSPKSKQSLVKLPNSSKRSNSLPDSPKLFLKNQQNIIYRCNICRNISRNSDEHEEHKKTHHFENKLGLTSGFKCNHCNSSFLDESKLETHQNQCKNEEKHYCAICKLFVNCKGALRKHKQSRQHIANEETEILEKEGKFRCKHCSERFAHQILLTNHKKIHTEELKLLKDKFQIEKKEGSRLNYICKLCGKSTGNRSHLEEHIRVHTGERIYKCRLCESSFTTHGSLRMHLILHSNDRPYKCHICEVNYRHKKSLRIHLIKHSGANPFKCKYCDKTFARRWTKDDHERLLHTGETPYECEICGNWFKTSWYLNNHRREEHNIDTNRKRKVEPVAS